MDISLGTKLHGNACYAGYVPVAVEGFLNSLMSMATSSKIGIYNLPLNFAII